MPPIIHRVPVAEGVELHTARWDGGRERPFLLVHGLASNWRTWEGVAQRLHQRGHPVAAVDLRGHGQSSKPDGGYDFGTLTSDLLAVLRSLGWHRPVVAGQSTGGNLAVELACRASGSVSGAVGVDGGVLELQEQWPVWEECRNALAPPTLAGTPADRVREELRHNHPDWAEEGVAATLANLEVLSDGTVRPWLTFDRHMALLRSLWEHRPSRLLPDLPVPLLLILADSGDDWVDHKRRAADRAVATAAGSARVEWFSPGDHDLHVQHPDEVARMLSEAATEGFFPS
ncbi:MAG: alpha/beta fold hydrolase [Acidimicrobiia bacterium]